MINQITFKRLFLAISILIADDALKTSDFVNIDEYKKTRLYTLMERKTIKIKEIIEI